MCLIELNSNHKHFVVPLSDIVIDGGKHSIFQLGNLFMQHQPVPSFRTIPVQAKGARRRGWLGNGDGLLWPHHKCLVGILENLRGDLGKCRCCV